MVDSEKILSQLIPWGLGLKMNRTLNQYVVKNCSSEVKEGEFNVVVNLERISGPFWLSLFIPSICLIVAAEVALFLDEAHFQALIMVALTSTLVTYNLYHTIQEELPRDSSFKLIDLWLLHGLVMPMIVFVTLAANELIKTKTTEDTKLKKIAKVGNHGSATTYIKKGGTMKTSHYSRSTCMLICKTIIPTSSLIFIIGFFFVCWIHGRH